MIQTPLNFLIQHTKNKWLYKNSLFIYPIKFGVEDVEFDDEYSCECLIVDKMERNPTTKIYKIEELFDAIFVDENRFGFLKSIEAKYKLLQ